MTLTREQIAEIIRAVAELPDRTSPDEQPDMMLVTHEELEGILKRVGASEPGREARDAALLGAFYDAWIECEVAMATGSPALLTEKRARLTAIHNALKSSSRGSDMP